MSLYTLKPKQIDDNTYVFIVYEDAILNGADYAPKGFECFIYPFSCEKGAMCNVCGWRIDSFNIYFDVVEGANKASLTIYQNFNDFDIFYLLYKRIRFYLKSFYLDKDKQDNDKNIHFSCEEIDDYEINYGNHPLDF